MIAIWSPVRNEARHIEEMLRSVLGQTYQDWRLIVSDNHSNDGTAEIVERYCGLDDRITLVRPPHAMPGQPHGNWLWHYVAGTQSADAAMFIGGHDTINRNYVASLWATMSANPTLSCTYAKTAYMTDDENRIVHRWGSCPQTIGVRQPAKFLSMLIEMGHNIPLFGLMRWDAFCAVSPTRACTAHDHFISAELTLHGDSYEVDGAVLSLRRSPGFGDYDVYRAKHMDGSMDIVADIRTQLEWLDSIATQAVAGEPPYVVMATLSFSRLAYVMHRFNITDAGTQQLLQQHFPKLWALVTASVEVA